MRLLATAGRVLSQLRRDPRTVALMAFLPMLLVGLFAWVLPANQFDQLGPMLIALFPFIVMSDCSPRPCGRLSCCSGTRSRSGWSPCCRRSSW